MSNILPFCTVTNVNIGASRETLGNSAWYLDIYELSTKIGNIGWGGGIICVLLFFVKKDRFVVAGYKIIYQILFLYQLLFWVLLTIRWWEDLILYQDVEPKLSNKVIL